MKKDELIAIGLSDEQAEKVFAINGRDIERYKKAADTARADLDAANATITQRDKDIEELRKSSGDADGVKKQLEELQAKYQTETQQYQQQIADRDYADAVHRSIADKGVKFSSKAAEKSFVADLTANRLTVKDGTLDGFDAYLKIQRESDPDAFQGENPNPSFTRPAGAGGKPGVESKGAMFAKQFNQAYTTNTTKE